MDQRDSLCPYLLSSEPTAKGTGLAQSAGKEDPVELDSSPTLWNGLVGVGYVGALQQWNTTTSTVILLIPLDWASALQSFSFKVA